MTRSEGRAAKVSVLALSCIILLRASPAPARAVEHDEAGARVLFGEGRKLADGGQYAEACLKFEESLRLDPGLGTSFNLADCQEHLGRVASAWARFLDVAAATRLGGQIERERVARARAAALEPKLARLVIEVGGPVEGLVVERDGVPVGAPAWGSAVPVDPGPHQVTAQAPGRETWSRSATVPPGPATVIVSVPALETLSPKDLPPARVEAAQDAVPPAGHLVVAAPPVSRPGRRFSPPVVTLGALGGGGLAAGLAFALILRSENGRAEMLCLGSPGNTCATTEEMTRHDELVVDARRDRAIAYVSAGVGAAALLTAAYLWWRPSRAPATRRSAAPLSAATFLPALAGMAGAELEIAW